MKYKLLALLTDRPDDINWSVLDVNHPAVKWVQDYHKHYGSLPTLQLFAEECLEPGEQPIATAPWSYYEREHADLLFVQQATKHLEQFNKEYADDPKKAILLLRDHFAKLSEPVDTTQPADIAKQTAERWERFSLKKGARIKIGIQPFDDATGGISPDAEYLIVSARLGSGKSFIGQKFALEMAKQGLNVGLYSGEMSEYEVGARIDTWLTHVSNWDLTRGKIKDPTEQIQAYAEQVPGKILVLTQHHLQHIARPSDLRRFAKENDLSVLVIDQLSLMQPDGHINTDSTQNFANLSMQLKVLQQELRIPIIALSQLNREAQGADPTAANISGSDRIGQDATIVLALTKKDNELVIAVTKGRSFKMPKKGWTFTWDVDTGVLSYQETGIDAILAKKDAAKKADKIASQVQVVDTQPADEEEDYE